MSVPPLYEESFKKAILTFRHQRVYDPTMKDIVHLSDLPDNIGNDLEFLGPYPSNRICHYSLIHSTFYLFLKLFGLYLNVKYIDTATDSYRYSKRGSGSVYSNAIPGSFFVYIFFVFISSFSSSSSFKIVDASSFRPWI